MLLVDTLEKKIEEDEDLKMRISISRPHKKLTHNRIYLDQLRKDDVVNKLSLVKKIFILDLDLKISPFYIIFHTIFSSKHPVLRHSKVQNTRKFNPKRHVAYILIALIPY